MFSTKHTKHPNGCFVCLFGADRENRTPDSSLARTRFTTKPYPLAKNNSTYSLLPATPRLQPPLLLVLPPGLEPGTTDPKSVMISISPRERLCTAQHPKRALTDSTPELGERLPAY